MANTVNDVMNVIASPDYGIKNIAGTTQEILAIMQGTHNSKNNIHAIVDDVRNLLQKLVDISTQKKPVEVGGNSTKINHKHIQDILDETKSIRKSIDELSKSILKKEAKEPSAAIAKLSDKASQKVANAMIKNIEKQKSGGGLSALVDAFNKLKDISIKDLILGNLKIKKIANIFKNIKKDLNIKEKDLNNIIKLINYVPEMMESLYKIGWRVNRIIKNNTIEKIGIILVGENSILSLSRLLKKNEKTFNAANKTTKDIKELVSSLTTIMKDLVFASLWSKLANDAIKNIENIFDKIILFSNKLAKNKKNVDDGAKAAKNITVLIGNLLITSIFLTITAVIGIPAILGAKVIVKLIDIITPSIKKLSNNKHLKKAVVSSVLFVAFTGIMAVASLALASLAVTGIPALIGSVFLLGIVAINVVTFKMLKSAQKNILIGSVMMGLMSVSLLIYSIALGKITKATENVTWKQVGIIATTLVMFALATGVMGVPVIAAAVALGSLAMTLLSAGLIEFGTALEKISKSTKNLKFKQIFLVSGSILAFGVAASVAGLLSAPIALGSIAISTLSSALKPFLKTLIDISKSTENLKIEQLDIVVSSMGKLGLAVSGMSILTVPITLGSVALGKMGSSLFVFVKTLKMIKDMGNIPQKEVETVLNIMKNVGDFFKNNALKLKSIMVAKRYQKIMRPLSEVIRNLSKLNKIEGGIPTNLVYQTLNVMKTIANYYIENPIEKKAIKQAKRYKKMMKPFGKTLKYFVKLKEMGSIPMNLVYQTLNTMKTIANYYSENPIEKNAIKQAKRYKKIMDPFCETLNIFSNIKDLKTISSNAVKSTTDSMGYIMDYYNNVIITDNIEEKSTITECAVTNFTNLANQIQDKFSNIKPIDIKPISSIIKVCRSIMNYYSFTLFLATTKKIKKMNTTVDDFIKVSKLLKDNTGEFTEQNLIGVNFAIKSMKRIINFLKNDTLNNRQIKKARKNISVINDMRTALLSLSNINQSNVSSFGVTISNALSGVNNVDLGKVQAVTNMFNAFNAINKSENIINKFSESVKEFTKTCKNLMDAMNYNTDAINNMDTSSMNGSIINNENNNIEVGGNNTNDNGGVHITNVDEIARTIAEKINGVLSVDVPDTQVQLLINGTGGNEWTISRY